MVGAFVVESRSNFDVLPLLVEEWSILCGQHQNTLRDGWVVRWFCLCPLLVHVRQRSEIRAAACVGHALLF